MKKLYITIVVLALIVTVIAVYYYFSKEKLETVGSGDRCQEDYQCPEGYKCGLKIDPLPGAWGECIKR